MAEEHANSAYFTEIDMDDFKEVIKGDDASFKKWAPDGIPQIWVFVPNQKTPIDVTICIHDYAQFTECVLWHIEEARKITSAPEQPDPNMATTTVRVLRQKGG
jgi:hypothetical protein